MPAQPAPLVAAYLALSHIAGPAWAALHRARLRAGKEEPTRTPERHGQATAPRPPGPLIWFHAASVGESQALIGLIARLAGARPDLEILLTTGTRSSAELIARSPLPRTRHQYLPFDTPRAVRAFLAHWRPDLAVWTESELWPRLLAETRAACIPMRLINTRISARTAARWRRWPRTARALLAGFGEIHLQDQATADLMAEIGIAPARLHLSGALKADLPPPPADAAELARLRAALGARGCWLAASTHPGEEAVLAKAHEAAHGNGPEAPLLIIAPRHPERGPELAGQLAAEGWAITRRAAGEGLGGTIHIADTLGEMGLWYRLAPVAFVAGSLANKGGHNPWEPAALGCAILHGPHVSNFAQAYARLHAEGGAWQAQTPDEIAGALASLADPASRAAQTAAARAALAQSGATAAIASALLAALPER